MSRNTACAPFVRASVAAILGSAMVGHSAGVLAAEEIVENEDLAEVQVTGTRIQQRGNYAAPNPVTSVTAEDLQRLAIVNVSDALTTLVPQNLSNVQPTNIGGSPFFIGQTLANLRGLNTVDAFGTTIGSRTLTLVDGRRVVSTSNLADVVDLNIIPSNLLQRADVVTGGASAAYGSGAMAGVVNLVLNNRLQGINADIDYGITEAGDGAQRHIALSGGTSVFGGRGHFLLGGEWQENDAIQGCGERAWCRSSSNILGNASNTFLGPGASFTPLPGYEGLPSRVVVGNLRYNQFSPNGVIAVTRAAQTSGYRFARNDDGSIGAEEYAFGINGGSGWTFGPSTVVNGDGPPAFSLTTITPASNRRTAFSRFEFDFTERVSGYAEANYSKTSGVNRQLPSSSTACVRFNTPGSAGQAGAAVPQETLISFANEYSDLWNTLILLPDFIEFAGNPFVFPIVQTPQQAANATWGFGDVTLHAPFTLPEIPAQAPTLGPDGNAFLDTLDEQALALLMAAAQQGSAAQSGNAPNAGNAADQVFWGQTACNGNAAVYKVWNPQFELRSENSAETVRGVLGLKGRFGDSWRWEGYYQYGKTDSHSFQNNATTTYALAFALDSVIDNRGTAETNPTYGQPICRVARDGVLGVNPANEGLSSTGEPLNVAALEQIAIGCRPLNIFGPSSGSPEALAYAFRPQSSNGATKLHVVSLNTSGTLWNAWAGPLTGAFGVEWRQDSVDNAGSRGANNEVGDIQFSWPDAFGGKTTVLEEYAELNLPIVTDQPGIKQFSINGAVRHARYRNKGGVGTTGESGTQTTTNWKFSTIFEPFDWVRLRLTRSRDLRAAGYRELYQNQLGLQDAGNIFGSSTSNPWRAFSSTSGKQDRFAQNFIGNPDLRPEKSDTLTIGFVLAPGGWAQGMRFSADYYSIRVRDGLTQTFGSPVQQCWSESGNQDAVFEDTDNNPDTPDEQVQEAILGRFDPTLPSCQKIRFADDPASWHPDYLENQLIGPYSNILSYSSSYENQEPFQTRGLDFSWNYFFPLARALESLPGSVSLSATATRALEASGNSTNAFCPGEVDYVGQLNAGLGCIPGIQPTPKWAGNFAVSYLYGNFVGTLSARYVGAARIDKVYYADGPGQVLVFPAGPTSTPVDPWQTADGRYLWGSIDNNHVPDYFNFSLNGSYSMPLQTGKQVQVFASINNLFDKDPPITGGNIAGGNPMFHDTLGRSYRFGVRVRF